MTGQTAMVQPIALLRAGCHEDAVTAAALASVRAYLNTAGDPAWAVWLDHRFAKTVRRARRGPFTAVAPMSASRVHVGDAEALGFIPCTYGDMLPALSKMQVEGTELPRTGWSDPVGDRPLLIINEGVAMSTGKTCAQAAHGLLTWCLRQSAAVIDAWVHAGAPVDVHGYPQQRFTILASTAAVTISDAGFTEITPGTMTVAVA